MHDRDLGLALRIRLTRQPASRSISVRRGQANASPFSARSALPEREFPGGVFEEADHAVLSGRARHVPEAAHQNESIDAEIFEALRSVGVDRAGRRDRDFELSELLRAFDLLRRFLEAAQRGCGGVEILEEAIPTVALGDGTAQRRRGHAPHVNGRVGLLHGKRPRLDAREVRELALEGGLLLRPQSSDDFDVLRHARAAFGERNSERIELALDITYADAEEQPTLREHVDACEFFGEHDGLALREQDDAGTELDLFGLGRKEGKRRDRVEGGARLLQAGCNDLGGTLMNETISRAAGASHGEEVTAADFEEVLLSIGRNGKQRTTLYGDAPIELTARS